MTHFRVDAYIKIVDMIYKLCSTETETDAETETGKRRNGM